MLLNKEHMLGSKLVDLWWSSPNKAFDEETPQTVWLKDYVKVYNYLMHHADGGW